MTPPALLLVFLAACADRDLAARVEALEQRQAELEAEIAALREAGPAIDASSPSVAAPVGPDLRAEAGTDGEISVDGAALRAIDPSLVARSVRGVPSRTTAGDAGLRLFGIRAGSVLDQLGFHNGDTVRAVNGRPLTSPDDALALEASLRDETTFDVSLERRGAPAELRIRLR